MSLGGARFLLLLEPGLEGGPIRAALPPTAPVHVAELAEGLARASQLLDDSVAPVSTDGHVIRQPEAVRR